MSRLTYSSATDDRWGSYSLVEQIANIGSEISRAGRADGVDTVRFWSAVTRAMDLFNRALDDSRHRGHLSEIARARDVFVDAITGGKEYGSRLNDLQDYYTPFALLARKDLNT